ncbi:MAG: hypothetical protein Q4P23_15805 [Micrococcaceae bacterium]|nr:hypothetical protein [Micrococcaceae bacterium]
METGDSWTKPTPEEARQLLANANTEEHATANRPVPIWYYPVIALVLFVIFALNSIDEPAGFIRVFIGVLVLVLASGVAVLAWRFSVNQPGYKGIHVSWGPTIAITLLAASFPIAAIALDDILGSWVWIAAGAALAALVLATGIPYQRKSRNG